MLESRVRICRKGFRWFFESQVAFVRGRFTSIHCESSQFRCLEPFPKIFWLISNGSLLVFLVCGPHTLNHHWRNCNFTQKNFFHEANPTFTHHKLSGDLRKLVSFTRGRKQATFFRDARFTAWHIASTFIFGSFKGSKLIVGFEQNRSHWSVYVMNLLLKEPCFGRVMCTFAKWIYIYIYSVDICKWTLNTYDPTPKACSAIQSRGKKLLSELRHGPWKTSKANRGDPTEMLQRVKKCVALMIDLMHQFGRVWRLFEGILFKCCRNTTHPKYF